MVNSDVEDITMNTTAAWKMSMDSQVDKWQTTISIVQTGALPVNVAIHVVCTWYVSMKMRMEVTPLQSVSCQSLLHNPFHQRNTKPAAMTSHSLLPYCTTSSASCDVHLWAIMLNKRAAQNPCLSRAYCNAWGSRTCYAFANVRY
jgi:hypothetical protein